MRRLWASGVTMRLIASPTRISGLPPLIENTFKSHEPHAWDFGVFKV